jgi:hypothetical protein
MKKLFFLYMVGLVALLPLVQVKAQQSINDSAGTISSDAQDTTSDTRPVTDAESAQLQLDMYLNSLSGEIQKEEAQVGSINASGEFEKGILDKLKLKPSDKKRLIKLFNGSLTDKEKQTVQYDAKLMELLQLLVTPTDLGGGGLDYVRVGDLLRFKQDPRSKETENTDNISAHQFGKAADITEINMARCTISGGLLGEDKALPPFPVKVIWQGGAPYNPNAQVLGSFDAVARSNALRDILGAIPGDSYSGSIQGLNDQLKPDYLPPASTT